MSLFVMNRPILAIPCLPTMEWVREKQNAQADSIEHPHYPYAWKRRFLPEAKRLLKALPAS